MSISFPKDQSICGQKVAYTAPYAPSEYPAPEFNEVDPFTFTGSAHRFDRKTWLDGAKLLWDGIQPVVVHNGVANGLEV